MNAIYQLNHLGVIKASGAEAASFLHSQLSTDIIHVPEQSVRLAAYCSPQGKMFASFIVCQADAQTFYLICSADLLQVTLKRLSMFILRAKVQLSDVSTELPLYGISYTDVLEATPPLQPWNSIQKQGNWHIELPQAAKYKRRIVIAADMAHLPELPTQPEAAWQWLDVQSGIALVCEATRDRYIPQMFNYESVGGVDFQKGCYPGQEVISRSQFRGTLKRKLFMLHGNTAINIGDNIASGNNLEEVCGEVVGEVILAAPAPQGGYDVLAVLRTDSADHPLADAQGAALTLLPLPYAIKEDF